MVFYKLYKYSTKATLLSAGASFLSLIFALLAIGALSDIDDGASAFIRLIIFAVLAVFCFVYLSRMLPDKVAQNDLQKKLRTKPKFAFQFCKENPQYFEAIAGENPQFAEQYRLNEEGKVVKID